MARVALITGCSSGIGLCTAIDLARAGYNVIATLRNLDKREVLEQRAEQAGVKLEIRALDVADEDSIRDCVEGVQTDHGVIDLLVNNAGFGMLGSVEQLSSDTVRHVMETNFFGVWNTTAAVLPKMREQRSGHIITITSVGGLLGQPFNDSYCAAKFAVEGMMESLAPVAGALGVRISIVEPGPVHTEFVASTRAASVPVLTSNIEGYGELVARYAESIGGVFEEHGQSSEEVAKLITQIADTKTPHLRYVTSDYTRARVEQKYVDPTGDSIVKPFAEMLTGS
jgi:NAD(P)-dependent dehydrogenase (short-subunit alcohol dehydrogenase family)